MTGPHEDVAVIGAGLVGLALAYELACLGARVVVVDAGHRGRATDAGAGILSPDTGVVDDGDIRTFLLGCGAHYPALLERLAADGADVTSSGYGVCGLLSVCLRQREDEWYAPFAAAVLGQSPGSVSEITPAEATSRFPPLGPVHRALYVARAARVDGRGMAAALRGASRSRGVAFVQGAVDGVVTRKGETRRVAAIHLEDGSELRCDALAVAGGAWTAQAAHWLDRPLPISPTKGQIVHLGVAGETGTWPIVQPLLTHYLVPWPGGRVACGGTFERGAGFSTTVTAAALHELLRECLSVAPGLDGATYLETRVGLRPSTPDDRAAVGLVPGWENAWVATGHGANGLLQGPYSARLLAHLMRATALPTDEAPLPGAFDPARFT